MEKEKLYLEIINVLKDGVYFVDQDRRITFWNNAAEEITGYSREEIVGVKCQDTMLNHIDHEGRNLCEIGCPLYATIIDGVLRSGDVFVRHKNGQRIPIKVNMFPVEENGEIIGGVEVFVQSSPVVYDDDLIEDLANSAAADRLTGLPNRRSLETFLEFKLSESRRFGRKFCVVFLDLDDFGGFNKNYGHDVGDAVLKATSASVMHTIRNTDMFGRWGGEEFLGIFEISQDHEATLISEKIRVLVSKSEVSTGSGEVSISASLGATVVRDDDTLITIIQRADELMRRSKEKGKNRVSFSS
ncbi:MAG: GGDEF domain-containing protein [Clostridiales bacterium]|jgi:diguanylate cyclase (GGDEF)-like protein/PAS domain S-box-containing protein|nr:GGDEF domain-containing protein [Clostridiales bacterium]